VRLWGRRDEGVRVHRCVCGGDKSRLINVNYFCRLTTTILAGRRHVHGDGLGDVLVRFGRGVLPAEVRGWVGSEEMAGGAG